MKDPCDDIRDWLYTLLSGNIVYSGSTVPVYSFPPVTATYPYIVIGEHTAEGEESTKHNYIWDVATQIHVYTQHLGHDASYIPANTISSLILNLVRTRAATSGYGRDEGAVAMANFNVIRVRVGAFSTNRILNDNEIIISKQISINTLLEEY